MEDLTIGQLVAFTDDDGLTLNGVYLGVDGDGRARVALPTANVPFEQLAAVTGGSSEPAS